MKLTLLYNTTLHFIVIKLMILNMVMLYLYSFIMKDIQQVSSSQVLTLFFLQSTPSYISSTFQYL